MSPQPKPKLTPYQQEELNKDLSLAARDNNFEGVQVALEDGADVNVRFGTQKTAPIHFAAAHGNVKMASLLARHGASIESENVDGDRPLHHAARGGKASAVQFLLGRGADVDAQNADGVTPLHLAVECQSEAVVKAILDAGADVSLHGDTLVGHATALQRAEDKVAELAGTTQSETAHIITNRIYRYEQSLETPLPKRFDKATLTFEDRDTVALLDQPRVWKQFGAIMEQMKNSEEGALTKTDLLRFNVSRSRWIQRGVECHAAGAVLDHLHANNEWLTADDLVSTQGAPTALLKVFIDNEEVGTLMQVKHWLNEGLSGFKRVLNALPEDTRDTLGNVHAVQNALQRAERANSPVEKSI